MLWESGLAEQSTPESGNENSSYTVSPVPSTDKALHLSAYQKKKRSSTIFL